MQYLEIPVTFLNPISFLSFVDENLKKILFTLSFYRELFFVSIWHLRMFRKGSESELWCKEALLSPFSSVSVWLNSAWITDLQTFSHMAKVSIFSSKQCIHLQWKKCRTNTVFSCFCKNTVCQISDHMTRGLRHAAAGPWLRLLFFYWLLQFQKRRVSTGRCVINRAAIGGDQWHARVVRVDFGIGERVRGAIAKVTIEQGVV